jgi:hypothetical protein
MKRAVVTAALLVATALAHAHGGLPVSQRILRQADGDTMYVPVVYWGVWVGQPGGPWKWICEEMINGNRFRKFALSNDGTFYTTDTKGLTRSIDHGCTWTKVDGALAALHPTDVVADPFDSASAWVSTGDGGTVLPDGGIQLATNSVYVTHDHGDTWSALTALASDRLYTSVRASPVAQQLLYVTSGAQAAPFAPTLHRSSDGGAHFTDAPLAYMLDGVAPYALELLALDPRNADVVWARAIAVVPTGSDSVTRQALLRSSDGGASWRELTKLDAVTEPSGQTRGIDGVAWDTAAGRVYVATRTGLLSGDDAGDATAPTLAPTGTLAQTQCVDVHGGAVYACSSQFPPDNAAIARSADGAKTFASVLNYVDTVGPVDCPADTPVGAQCPLYWYMYGAQLGISFDGGTQSDMGPPPMSGGGGCGCSVGAMGPRPKAGARAAGDLIASAVGGVAFAALLVAIAVRIGARYGGRGRRRG